jgi:glycosyltransferase involved in cell wall biosynthesis
VSNLQRRSDAKSGRDCPSSVDVPCESLNEQPAIPQVTILMCTFNGARFLPAQLASIEQQSHWNWRLIVSDDGSRDATLAIIHHFAERVSRPVEVRHSPRCGPAANFISLAADPTIESEHFAFCDQDDVWHADKLSSALRWLETIPSTVPAVYGARTRLVSASGAPIGHAPLFRKPPSFANALAQSIAGANTMLFNSAAKRLFEQAGPLKVVSHDWWAYQLVTGSGGMFRYDSQPNLDYRQHSTNRIGCNRGLTARWKRLRMVLAGQFVAWNDINLVALQQCRHLLTEEASTLVDTYAAMRQGTLFARLKAFFASGIRRQTLLGTAALLTAVLVKKL